MVDEKLGISAPLLSVRPSRNRLADEDRALLEERRRRHKADEDEAGTGAKGGGSPSLNHDTFEDDILVFGIPKEDMTVPVRKAIDVLVGQINELRAELMNAHGHEAFLEDQVEKDRLLHIMRRTVLMARLGLAARRVEEEHVSFCVLYFAVQNEDAVRTKYGAGAVESMLLHTADILRDNLDAGDLVGTLDHSDFGVVLPGTMAMDAVKKGHDLLSRIGAYFFDWQGQRINIEAKFGVTEIMSGDSGDDIIERARTVMKQSTRP